MKFAIIVFSIFSLFLGALPVFAETTPISDKVIVLQTPSGDMIIELFPNDAPKTVANFLNLTEHRFYDRTVFHRVIKDFMIQGGDPKTKPGGYEHLSEWGTGDAGYTIPGEFNTIKHKRGIVSMARGYDPDSASSQFFIVHKDSFFLDQNYAVFGRLITNSSYQTLDKIANLNANETTNYVPYSWGKGEILKAEVKKRTEIPELLDLGEPERVDSFVNQTAQEYSNEKLGIFFIAPAGWLVQEPTQKTPNSPDIVAVGAKIAGFSPAISVSVKDANATSLDDYTNKIKQSLQTAIDTGNISILSEDKTTINGNEAFTLDVLAKFNTGQTQINVKFKEIIIKSQDKFYTFTYTNSERNFASALDKFTVAVNSFKIISELKDNSKPEKTGCLVATAAYGSELAPQVQLLREIRDNILFSTSSGTKFMTAFNAAYYSFSPTISDWERQNPTFKEAVKITIFPLLSTLSILNYVDIDSDQEMLGYGIGIILLNIGMYFVVPTIIIVKSKNKIQRFIAKI